MSLSLSRLTGQLRARFAFAAMSGHKRIDFTAVLGKT